MTDVPCTRVAWFQIPAHDLHRAHALYRSVGSPSWVVELMLDTVRVPIAEALGRCR